MSLAPNPRKQITVEVDQVDTSGCRGYSLYHIRRPRDKHEREPRLIARDVDDGQIMELLSDHDWRKFEKGSYQFRVSAERVIELFQYLP